jgi:hypothetical protein
LNVYLTGSHLEMPTFLSVTPTPSRYMRGESIKPTLTPTVSLTPILANPAHHAYTTPSYGSSSNA